MRIGVTYSLQTIIVDGEKLVFRFQHLAYGGDYIEQVSWNDDKGTVELGNGTVLEITDWAVVEPYYTAWKAEMRRRQQDPYFIERKKREQAERN